MASRYSRADEITREARKAYAREYYYRNKEQQLASAKLFRERNPTYAADYHQANKAQRNAYAAAYQRQYKGRRNEATRRYQAAKLQASPPWLSAQDIKQMQAIYEAAASSSEPSEVDHIVPLQGDKVCGLHVPWNLQVLPKLLNRRKGNTLGF